MTQNTLLRKTVPTIAALLVFALTMRLGFWQLDRAHQRESLDSQLSALKASTPIALGDVPVTSAALEFHSLEATGEWQPQHRVFLDNQIFRGRPGFHVFMPLKLEGSNRHVLVNRGWIAGLSDREKLPVVNTVVGSQRVSGFARLSPPTFSSIAGTSRVESVWSELSLKGFAQWSGLQLQPVILYQVGGSEDGLVREWPNPGLGAERNRGYAFQWFALAVMTAVFWAMNFYRRRDNANKNHE